ncbi:TPA: ATP-dependent DNA helicase, partial [Candidatus Woesearchaeota archaeon]|nr:ATP-dependent DNA helicase [Candidatus Woesearchaeota archaeon]
MTLKEDETTELKRSTAELKEAIVSIAAVLNKSMQGRVYFGVRNDGTVVGQTVTEQTVREIAQAIANNIEPKVYPRIHEQTLEDKKIVVVETFGRERPYYAYGRAYVRVGDENRQMSAQELEKMIIEKNKDKLRWDREICEGAKITDISREKVEQFLRKADLSQEPVEKALEKLNLTENSKITNTAISLFGKEPERFFFNLKLRTAVFATDTTSMLLDMQEYTGDVFDLIDKAEEYILKNIHIGMIIEGLRRVDIPEIDRKAIREAIINAFCHRNYYDHDSVHIAIFRDRLEIRSPGLLYGGLTIERIKKETVSKRRNELLAEMLHRVHYVERWGKGIKMILEREPSTEFKEYAGLFFTVFKRKGEKTREKTR